MLLLLHPRLKDGTGVHVRHQGAWHEGLLCGDLPNLTTVVRPTFFNIVNRTEPKPCFLMVTYDILIADALNCFAKSRLNLVFDVTVYCLQFSLEYSINNGII